ncbi:hypothetical protein niasHT_026679 [Heterodera trifolii]|uniref:Uncharacterized protein n=1 Tax=Heterodera trifolii TaxID=157864 RepID=A0ABD2JSN4_9BILA
MNFVLLFIVELLILCACCVTTSARRRVPAIRFHEPNRYLIKRNFVTGSFHYKNLSRITEPPPVRRLRLMVTLNEATGSVGFIEVFRIKVRWVGPELWWDNMQSAGNNRFYELRCEIEDEHEGMPQTFLKLNVDASMNGYDENFLVRQPFPLLLRCRMRSVNGAGLFSRWIWTNTVKLYTVVDHHQTEDQQRRRRLLLWRKHRLPVATYLGSENTRVDDADSNEEEEEEHQQQQQQISPADGATVSAAEEQQQQQQPLSSSFAVDTQVKRRTAQEASHSANTRNYLSPEHFAYQPNGGGGSYAPRETTASSPSTPLPEISSGHHRFQQQLRMPHWELLNRRNTAGGGGDGGASVEAEQTPPSAPPPPYFLRPPIEFS